VSTHRHFGTLAGARLAILPTALLQLTGCARATNVTPAPQALADPLSTAGPVLAQLCVEAKDRTSPSIGY
jgi:hypothetical protein